jgi:soluble lytic murein transglycosylase-like protein
LSATRILAGLPALALAAGLSACSTSGIDIGAELEAVSHLAASEHAIGSGTDGSFASQTMVIPADRPEGPTVAYDQAEASGASTDNADAPVIAYAGPAPSGVQAVAAGAATTAATAAVMAPRMRLIHPVANVTPREIAPRSAELDALIARYAAHYELPLELVRRVVNKESTFNPMARNRIYWGLMQIRHDTAQTMGYRGPAEGLLDAETNLNYAVRYLRGAWLTADFDQDRAVRLYQRGYYYDARRKGILHETGLRR